MSTKIVAIIVLTVVSFISSITIYYHFFYNVNIPVAFQVLDSISDNGAEIVIKHNCYWDNPGNNPWKGDSLKLLQILGLTKDESISLIKKYENNEYNSIVYISNNMIVEDMYPYRSFKLNMDMSSGTNILCKNTLPGRNWGYKKYKAKLFIIENKYLIIPEICGNITRIYLDTLLLIKPKNDFGHEENHDRFSTLPYDSNTQKDTKSIVYVSNPSTLFLMIFILFLLKIKR